MRNFTDRLVIVTGRLAESTVALLLAAVAAIGMVLHLFVLTVLDAAVVLVSAIRRAHGHGHVRPVRSEVRLAPAPQWIRH